MKWSDPQDRADRRVRHAIWTAALIALLLPVWWNIVSTVFTAILLRQSAHAFDEALQQAPPVTAPYRAPQSMPTPTATHPTPVVRVLGAMNNKGVVNILVDLDGTMPQQSQDKICRDGGAFIARSLSGEIVYVLRSRGTQPAISAGTIVRP